MARIPKITVEAWGPEGPAYTIHRPLVGRRNRHRRRAGESDSTTHGDPDAPEHEYPAGFLVWAEGDDEVWALNRGFTYHVDVLIDGVEHTLLIDALEDYAVLKFNAGLSFVEWSPVPPPETPRDPDAPAPEPSAGDDEDAVSPVCDSGKSADEEE